MGAHAQVMAAQKITGGPPAPTFATVQAAGFTVATASPLLTYPTVVTDDIMLAVLATDTTHASSGTPPTGWTKIGTYEGSTNTSVSTFWRRADGSEPGTETWTNIFASSETGSAVVIAYRGCTTSGSPFDGSGAATDSAANTAYSQAITTTVPNTRVVFIYGTDPSVDPTTVAWDSPAAERIDGDTSPNGQAGTSGLISIADREAASAGVVTTTATVSAALAHARIAYALKS